MNANASGTPPRLAATPLNAVTSDRSHFGRRIDGRRVGEQGADDDADGGGQRRQLHRELERVEVLAGEGVLERLETEVAVVRRCSAFENTLIAGMMRNSDRNARNGTRPSHAQLRGALAAGATGAARKVRPPSTSTASVTIDVRRRRPSGPSSRRAPRWRRRSGSGVRNSICEISSSGGRLTFVGLGRPGRRRPAPRSEPASRRPRGSRAHPRSRGCARATASSTPGAASP